MALTPNLSIVIPTKDRQVQCIETIRSVLAFDEAFELVVFDSSETAEPLAEALDAIADPRVRHVHAASLSNMTQCFEAALATAQAEYVCMIGDDDGVTRALFDWTRRAAADGLTSVTSDPTVYGLYNWPGIRSKYFGDAASGKLFMRLDPRVGTRVIDAKSQVREFLNAAGQGCGAMPRVYHGIVARPVLEAIKAAYGRCFDGVSPDVSFSYFAAQFSPRHAIIDVPLTISGASVASNAGRSAMGRHKGDLWSDPHMKGYADEPWPEEVPEFFSVEAVWGQATLAALARSGADQRRAFNYARFYPLLFIRHPDRWREIAHSLNRHRFIDRLNAVMHIVPVAVEHALGTARKVVRRIRPDPMVRVLQAASIGDASIMVDDLLASRSQATRP